MSEKTNSTAMYRMLERHYIDPKAELPGGVLLDEVTMGGQGGRRADALYVGFTAASGRRLVGHEIKVSRSDWLAELRSPKADAWADQCHAWYVVAPAGLVPVNELPEGWGLMEPPARANSTRMHVLRPARVHADRQPSWETTRSLLSRMDTQRAGRVRQVGYDLQQARHADVEARAQEIAAQRDRGRPDAEALRTRLAAIEGALGRRVLMDGERDDPYREGNLTLADLRRVGSAAHDARVMAKLLEQMAAPWSTPLGPIKQQIEQLDRSVTAIQEQARRLAGEVPG